MQKGDDDLPDKVKMVFAANPSEEVFMKRVDSFGIGEDEPDARAKWSDGKALFVWLLTEEDAQEYWYGDGLGWRDNESSGSGGIRRRQDAKKIIKKSLNKT